VVVVAFNRTLEQELLALARGVSLECLVCGEFVLKHGDAFRCPECDSTVSAGAGSAQAQLDLDMQAG
jgi:Zn finger protein HypA/HybF involved in hydrogenase expression